MKKRLPLGFNKVINSLAVLPWIAAVVKRNSARHEALSARLQEFDTQLAMLERELDALRLSRPAPITRRIQQQQSLQFQTQHQHGNLPQTCEIEVKIGDVEQKVISVKRRRDSIERVCSQIEDRIMKLRGD